MSYLTAGVSARYQKISFQEERKKILPATILTKSNFLTFYIILKAKTYQ
jgi:hypothetical protein